MHKDFNPWMISTTLLIGMIIGFAIGRTLPVTSPIQETIGGTAQNQNTTPPSNTDSATTPSGTPPPTPAVPLVNISYDNIPKELTKDGNWTLGNKNAKVRIDEFSDFQCPYCHKFFSDNFESLFKDYIAQGKVYYVYYNFPLSFHPQAKKGAQAALCAGDQQKFWDMHDLLFNQQDEWSFQETTALQTFQTMAQKLQLNMDTFNQCMSSEKFAKQIEKDSALGAKKNITGTPSFFINGKGIVGAQDYSVFQTTIDEALNKK